MFVNMFEAHSVLIVNLSNQPFVARSIGAHDWSAQSVSWVYQIVKHNFRSFLLAQDFLQSFLTFYQYYLVGSILAQQQQKQ